MKKFYPTMYQKSIFEIPYQKLKKQGVRLLIFDLDNTIALIDQETVDKRTVKLFHKLQKDFQLVILSNNNYSRVEPYAEMLQCDFVASALKPLKRGYKRIIKKYGLSKEQMGMIGDQLITDIYGGNRMTGCTVLVDPLGIKDLKISKFNRILERMIFCYFEKTNQMKKGVYYE